LQRHGILRSSFHSIGLTHPVQVVHEGLHPTWQIEDWRDQPAAARDQLWKDLLKADATRANNLAAPSLTRFSLIRLEETDWRFLWSVPGIMMDGWSWPIVFGEVSQLMSGAALLAPANAYSSYLKWLKECGTSSEEIFWKAELAGLSAPTPVPLERPVHQGGGKRFIETSSTLDIDLVERLTRFSRQHHVTTAALAHAAWALVLARGAANEDIVFGTASNGRPNEVPGVESIVGPFTNNLPVRLAVRADQPVRDFINDVQAKLFTLSAHQYSSMQQMQNWSEMPWNCRLFDSLLVFQNYSGNDTVRELAPGVDLRDFTGPLHTNYPLMLVVTPGVVYDATLVHQESSCSVVRANTLLHDWKALLDKLTDPSNPSISALLDVCQLLPGTSPSHQPSDRPVDRMAPRTALEKKIAAVWQRAFGLSDIAINENFFDLGGQSLLMLRVQQTLREELGLNLSIVQVFQHPTIASLAQSLEPPVPSATVKPTTPPGNNPQSLAVQARNRAAAARAAIAKSRGHS
jgi:aryl carrier-like protein